MRIAVQCAAFGVAALVQRRNHLAGELTAFFQHRVDGVNVDLGMRWKRLEHVSGLEQFVQHEVHVAQWGRVSGHAVSW